MCFFFKQKTAYEMLRSLVGSEMCIRDRIIAEALHYDKVATIITFKIDTNSYLLVVNLKDLTRYQEELWQINSNVWYILKTKKK